MESFLISLILGMIPELLYFTLYISIYKKKKFSFLILILTMINYIVTGIFTMYNPYSYIIFIFLEFIILKLLYKKETNITDLFFIMYGSMYLSLVSTVSFLFVKENFSNYYILYVISRIILFLSLLLKDKLNCLYIKYNRYWNKNSDDKKIKIKSITLRNISMIIFNTFILLIYVLVLYIKTLV